MQVKQQQFEPDLEQWAGLKLGKEYVKAVYCHLLINLYAEYIMWNAELDEAEAESRLLGEISTTSDKKIIPLWWQKVKRN